MSTVIFAIDGSAGDYEADGIKNECAGFETACAQLLNGKFKNVSDALYRLCEATNEEGITFQAHVIAFGERIFIVPVKQSRRIFACGVLDSEHHDLGLCKLIDILNPVKSTIGGIVEAIGDWHKDQKK